MTRFAARAALRSLSFAAALFAAVACGGEEATSSEPAAAAPAAPAASEPAPAAGLEGLRAFVGRYPRDIGLFESEPLHGRLVALLGDRMPVFLANMGTQGPVSAEGDVIYVIGNKPHAGGDSAAVLLVDLPRDLVHAYVLDEREMAELRERDEEIALPPDVQTTISNWQQLARDEE